MKRALALFFRVVVFLLIGVLAYMLADFVGKILF